MSKRLHILSKRKSAWSDERCLEDYKHSSNQDILAVLYGRYMPMVFGVCLKYLESETDAQDAVMSIYESLKEKLLQHEVKKFKPWLHTFTRNHCLMQLRKEKKNPTLNFDPNFMYSQDHLHPLTEEEAIDERLDYLKDCINRLKVEQKRVVKMFYFEEMSYKEIADALQQSLGKVRSYIQNGRRMIKNCIENKLIDE